MPKHLIRGNLTFESCRSIVLCVLNKAPNAGIALSGNFNPLEAGQPFGHVMPGGGGRKGDANGYKRG